MNDIRQEAIPSVGCGDRVVEPSSQLVQGPFLPHPTSSMTPSKGGSAGGARSELKVDDSPSLFPRFDPLGRHKPRTRLPRKPKEGCGPQEQSRFTEHPLGPSVIHPLPSTFRHSSAQKIPSCPARTHWHICYKYGNLEARVQESLLPPCRPSQTLLNSHSILLSLVSSPPLTFLERRTRCPRVSLFLAFCALQ